MNLLSEAVMSILQALDPPKALRLFHLKQPVLRGGGSLRRAAIPRSNGTPESSVKPRISTSASDGGPAIEWPFFAPYVKAINALKKERNRRHPGAHFTRPRKIYNCVADFVGDSLQLPRD